MESIWSPLAAFGAPWLSLEGFALILLLFVPLQRSLRYRRSERMQARYAPRGSQDYAELTNDDAQQILKDLTELEFPIFFGFSIVFALFKVVSLQSGASHWP